MPDPPGQLLPFDRTLYRFIHKLIDPHTDLSTEEKNRARFTAFLALCIFLINAGLLFISLWLNGLVMITFIAFVGAITALGTFLLSRTRFYRMAAHLITALAVLGAYAILLDQPKPHTALMWVLPIFITSQLQPIWVNLVVVLISMFGIYITPMPDESKEALPFITVMLVSLSILFIAAAVGIRRILFQLTQNTQQLLASESRYRSLFEQMQDAVFISDTQGYCVDLNPQAASLLGYRREDMIGKHFSAWSMPEENPTMIEHLDELRAGQALGLHERKLRHQDGKLVLVEINAQPIFNTDGQNLIQSVARDITERKRLEDQKIELVVERERIALLQKFIGDVSHDLMTPLTVLKTNVFLLSQDPPTEKRGQKLAQMSKQIERLENMIGDMLMMSRLDQPNDQVYEFIWHDVNRMLRELVEQKLPIAQEREQNLVLQSSSTLPPIRCDHDKLSRALNNLIDNAIQYTPTQGNIDILVSKAPNGVHINICDEGPGIPTDDLPHIFNSFYRGQAHRPDSAGAGLGLPIAKKIINAHGGHIQVENRDQTGTRFTVWLPIHKQLTQSGFNQPQQASPPSAQQCALPGESPQQ